jgi:acyl dehydratase
MSMPAERAGAEVGPVEVVIDPVRVAAFAEAIGDERAGREVPATYIVVPTFDLVVRTLTGAIGSGPLTGGVHGEEDIHLHRPMTPGMRLLAMGSVHAVRVSQSGTRIAMRIRATDAGGALVVEHYWTTFVRGATLGESRGLDPPDHQLTDGIRERPARHLRVPVADDVTWRYADASGDHSPFHTDQEAAQAAGFPTIILHGMCTVSLAVAAIAPRATRVAVRFAKPAYPGHPLEVDVYDIAHGVCAFEASSQGVPVLTNGRLETSE